ncbi:MAG: response regulator, partial [Geopsychrobacter sp.]|nr:response regulator [Geopsychrobacter sp.]
IRVESKVGQGCCFYVLLPLIEGEAPTQSRLTPQQLPHGDKHLLLVDDEESLVNISSEFLQDLGYRVSGFTSSIEALRTFEQHPKEFDLLITDLTMPGLTGLELAQKVRQINADLPIILCTGQQEHPQKSDPDKVKLLKTLHKPDLFTDMAFTLHQYFNN